MTDEGSGRRSKQVVVGLGVVAVVGALALADAGYDDAVCVDPQSRQRVPDGRCDDAHGGGTGAGGHWYYLRAGTRWLEPLWKVLLSSTTILVAPWECFPGHENLLPAALGAPEGFDAWVGRPVFGWEGAGIEVVAPAGALVQPAGHTAGQAVVHQQYVDLPVFDGARPVVGSRVVGGRPAGLGIRQSDGLVTDAGARFVPHVLDVPRWTPEQVEGWLADA